MAQLDALRTFAVAAVMVHHYTPSGWGFGGTGGVRLFFSLSGFLITGILLRSRERLESSELTLARALGRFYARRTLRIFPLYYFVIAAALALGLPPTRRLLGWLVTYTLNFHMARQGWYEESFAHFWSLAVEEQFYLAWPWLILALPRRLVLPAVLATIAVSPAYRLRYVLSGYTSVTGLATYISTLTCLDALGAGALLALLWRSVSRQRLLWFVRWLLLPGSLLLMFLLSRLENWHFGLVCGPLVFALLSTSVIALAAAGLGGVVGRLLCLRPLLYLGRISYGLYVFHPFMPSVARALTARLGLALPEHGAAEGALATLLTVGVASLSWYALERPLNDLKRHFEG
jgi:peptidoglycan/LPS O-acetylase OafA/YrhL